MEIIKTPWKSIFLELVNQSAKSIKITSPFVKNDICSELLDAKKSTSKIKLITSFKLNSFYNGSLDIEAIESIIDHGGFVKNYSRLHSKIYIFDDRKAIISSGNLTSGGLVKNFEYGVLIDEIAIVRQVINDYNNLIRDEVTGTIKVSHLKAVRAILNSLPKPSVPDLPPFKIETPEKNNDTIEQAGESIAKSLSGWKLEIFRCIDSIPSQFFQLREVNEFADQFKINYPTNSNIEAKIRQQLQQLRDIGLIEFLGHGHYKKLWKQVGKPL